jgi:acetyltransferase-like isoleucine patch superfamily enzyme
MIGWNEEIKKELKYCGEQVFIGRYTIFTNPKEVILEDRVRIDPFCLITTGLHVRSNSQICSHAVLGGGSRQFVKLGKWSWIGYGSQLFTATEDYTGDYGPVCEFWGSNKIVRGDIVFEDYAGVASQVMVFPGVTLPEGCAIGAQSFVHTRQDLKPWSLWYGNPLQWYKERNIEQITRLAVKKDWLKRR